MYTATGAIAHSPHDPSHSVQQFAPLVHKIAHHMQSRLPASVEVDDLIQAGMLGLLDALGRFEDGQGAQFETYASQRIRGAMLDELRHNDWLPRGVRKTQRDIERVLRRVEQRLGRSAAESEIASEMGVDVRQYQALLAEARGGQLVYYSDYDGDGEGGDPYLDRHCADHSADPREQLADARFKAALIDAIDALPEREKMLMGLYYEQELNFREIAAVFGVTESRVCQLHSQSVARLRTRLKDG